MHAAIQGEVDHGQRGNLRPTLPSRATARPRNGPATDPPLLRRHLPHLQGPPDPPPPSPGTPKARLDQPVHHAGPEGDPSLSTCALAVPGPAGTAATRRPATPGDKRRPRRPATGPPAARRSPAHLSAELHRRLRRARRPRRTCPGARAAGSTARQKPGTPGPRPLLNTTAGGVSTGSAAHSPPVRTDAPIQADTTRASCHTGRWNGNRPDPGRHQRLRSSSLARFRMPRPSPADSPGRGGRCWPSPPSRRSVRQGNGRASVEPFYGAAARSMVGKLARLRLRGGRSGRDRQRRQAARRALGAGPVVAELQLSQRGPGAAATGRGRAHRPGAVPGGPPAGRARGRPDRRGRARRHAHHRAAEPRQRVGLAADPAARARRRRHLRRVLTGPLRQLLLAGSGSAWRSRRR